MGRSGTKPLISVVGATGAQGSGLVHAIIADGTFTARALTRDPSKPSAFALKDAGVEVVAFDFNKPETYRAALSGAHGAFVVTNFYEAFAKETQQAKDIAAACEAAGVAHVIWSTLEDTRPFFDAQTSDVPPKLQDTMYVPHFDGKAEANASFPAAKTTLFHTSMYLENLIKFGMCKDGVMACPMGNTPLSVIAVDDIGRCALGVFKAGDEYKGKSVFVAGDVLTVADLMAVCAKATGKKFSYAAYAGFGFPGAEELANMFHYYKCDVAFGARRNPDGPHGAKALYHGIQSAAVWAEANKEQLAKCGAP
ncbi:hypothetical protein FOA52_014510 [Chlamydomonas sp. UWO 241]|nr:hypothetical protein FOA52_014510 [Chlamydomonas sp. UWO 241]